jgi:hypothetical protein
MRTKLALKQSIDSALQSILSGVSDVTHKMRSETVSADALSEVADALSRIDNDVWEVSDMFEEDES